MMAPESRHSPEPRALSEETLAALRRAVSGHQGHSPDSDESVRLAVDAVVAEARERKMRAEELILAFKAVYNSLPEPVSATARADQLRLREQLITACIKAYYGGAQTGS
jgi:hypothetical protein